MCTKKSNNASRHAITSALLGSSPEVSLSSLLPPQNQLTRALDIMDIRQSRFVGPPTPIASRENASMATLPDLFVLFIAPEPKVNPHYEEVKRESEEWMRKTLWKDLSERDIKKRCSADFCFFSAIMCPDVSKEEFRTVCDWIYWVFEFDDQFDEGELGRDHDKGMSEVAAMVSIITGKSEHREPSVRPRPNARHFPSFLPENAPKRLATTVTSAAVNEVEASSVPKDSATASEKATPLQLLFQSIWERIQKSSPRAVRERYVKSNVHFCHSVAELHGEEFDDMAVMENIRRYLHVRAQNIGLYPLLALEEYAYGVDLPQDVVEHEAIQEIERLVAEILTLQNDILSYHREHSVGHSQNLISIFRRRLGLTQQQSYDRADELLHRCYRQWYVAHAKVPCWGEKVDAQVQQYLKACLDVLRANVRWSFKSQRYFGADVDRVRATRRVVLVP
ncbi:terpene synthase metal binding domain protein [Diplodia corticola]|uniref:Terpene synthase n=1 Tax=Diplodia corticola TaxID=236234 RepID=A0A1J9S3C9_9PEZI|nr:terpene synthase metal binding domain protein [Diplodia corticola]OJD35063.1 terpene synthase metal binding domain protein [Diplodia corticola]